MNRFRILLGFSAGLVFLLFSHVSSWERAMVGLGVSLVGLFLRSWAAGYLEKGRRLAQDGPYATWRHPLYAGSCFMAFGFAVAGTGTDLILHAVFIWCTFILLFGIVYSVKILDEEDSLEKNFGEAWRVYRDKTRRFFPRLRPLRRDDPDRFQWGRFWKIREYNAWVGWMAGAALLAAKGILNL